MLTLGHYVKQLRGNKTQQEIADLCGFDHSMISCVESDRKTRLASVKILAHKGLKVSPEEWETIKLLWLQNQSGEPIFSDAARKAREKLILNESSEVEKFADAVAARINKNMEVISTNRLQEPILALLGNPKTLKGVKQFLAVYRALDPKSP